MLLSRLISLVSCLSVIVLANTETYLLKIPHYFEIVPCSKSINYSENYAQGYQQLNGTHRVLKDYPINTLNNPKSPHTFSLPYNKTKQEVNVLMVRVNNYNDSIFSNDDLIYVKLCWPATMPYGFDLSHEFVKSSTLVAAAEDSFDIFLKISYKFDAYSNDPKFLADSEPLKFHLVITKLPNRWMPIPLELYGTIIYIVDMLILSWTALPSIISYLIYQEEI